MILKIICEYSVSPVKNMKKRCWRNQDQMSKFFVFCGYSSTLSLVDLMNAFLFVGICRGSALQIHPQFNLQMSGKENGRASFKVRTSPRDYPAGFDHPLRTPCQSGEWILRGPDTCRRSLWCELVQWRHREFPQPSCFPSAS